MLSLYESSVQHFCNSDTYKVFTNVLLSKDYLCNHIENLPITGYQRQLLYNDLITNNPYGGATYTGIANIIRELIGDWIESYNIKSFHIENKDLKYIFSRDQMVKSVGVSFLITKEELRLMALKYPDFYQHISPTQLNIKTYTP